MKPAVRVILCVALTAIASSCSGASESGPAPATADPAPQAVWDLTSHLTEAQRAINEQVYASLPLDACTAENQFDPRAKELALAGTPEALRELQQLEHSGSREAQVAAGRAVLYLALQAMAAGDRETAFQHAEHIYLSGVPHALRLEALRVYCSCAPAERSLRTLQRIETGQQDARFAPMLLELHASRHAASKRE